MTESGGIDFKKRNREKLVELIASRFTDERRLGLRLEHIIVHKDTLAPVSYAEAQGMRAVLERLAESYDEQILEEGNLIGLTRPGEEITLEPGGQLMLSSGPFVDMDELERSYLDFRLRLFHVLEKLGLHAPMVGYHPTARAAELEVAPIPRYERIAEFIGAQTPYGVPMMRGTAALQVSVDCTDERDAIRKLRIASALAPILSLITDNAPVFEGRPREMQMARMHAWMSMRQDRVGTIPGIMDPDYSLERYADYILTRQAVYVRDDDGGFRSAGNATFDDVYADREMTESELEHALSMVWTDVRLGDGLEIRAADAMPFDYTLAYAAFIDKLFYDDQSLSLLETMLGGVGEEDIVAAKKSLIRSGYGGQAYGKLALFWTGTLLMLATGGPNEFDMFRYIEPLFSMSRARLTLAQTWDGKESGVTERRADEPDVAVQTGAPVIGILPHYDFETGDILVREGVATGVLAAGGMPFVLPRTDSSFLMWRVLETCDALLFVGGHDIDPNSYGQLRHLHQMRSIPKRDLREIALARAAIEMGKPILAICRGMQVLNVAFGGSLHPDISDCSPDSELDHVMNPPYSRSAHDVAVVPGTLLHKIVGGETTGVNSMHHQCVGELGQGLHVCAKAPDGVVEGIEAEEGFVLGVQWHPEYLWRTNEDAFNLFKSFVDAAAKQQRDESKR